MRHWKMWTTKGEPIGHEEGYAILIRAMELRPRPNDMVYLDFNTGELEYHIDCDDLPHYNLNDQSWKDLHKAVLDFFTELDKEWQTGKVSVHGLQ